MPVSSPESIGKSTWTKVKNGPKYVLKLYLPKISERNGPICCYRIYLVKILNGNNELPHPDKLNKATYHDLNNNSRAQDYAYLAEMLSSRYYKSELFLGDEMRFTSNRDDLMENDESCRKCLKGMPFFKTQETIAKTGKSYHSKISIWLSIINF